FEQQYALFAVISGDTTYQTVIITKSYDVPGFDPADYNGSPYVSGADVTIKYNDAEYKLKDTLLPSTSSEYPSNIYYTNQLMPGAFKVMEIKALLPDGKILSATTTTPKSDNLSFSRKEFNSDTYIENKPEGLYFIWDIIGSENDVTMYLPFLRIYYVIKNNAGETLKNILVPFSYFQSGNDLIPQYPPLSAYKSITYNMDAINGVMDLIGRDIEDKTTIYIKEAYFELLILDEHLAPYYQTVESFLDGFTVLLDQVDYTNINGGRGVFGSFFKRKLRLSFDPEYVHSFSYRIYK
ncbi:MAG: DUF4249 family protein, partial [Ignavibacteriaceae bacterium]|nr:DUF4249 family protein [Ignavibacteriaceae bacterium]